MVAKDEMDTVAGVINAIGAEVAVTWLDPNGLEPVHAASYMQSLLIMEAEASMF